MEGIGSCPHDPPLPGPQIRCMKLTLVFNGARRSGVSLDGGLAAAEINRRIASLLSSMGINPSTARFVDLLFEEPEEGDDAATLDIEALACYRLAPLLAAPPGEANLHKAGLLRPGDEPPGDPALPRVALDVHVPMARLPPRTPAPRSGKGTPSGGGSTHAASGGRRPPSGTPRPVDHTGASSRGGDDEAGSCDWDDDNDRQRKGRNQEDCPVVKAFMSVFKKRLRSLWVCVDKRKENAKKKCMYMNKEDWEGILMHVSANHPSRHLLRAVYGGALLDTMKTVGDIKLLLGVNLGVLNHKANNVFSGSFRWASSGMLPRGRGDRDVMVWGLYKNATEPFTLAELEGVWEARWDKYAAGLNERIEKLSQFCAGHSVKMEDLQAVAEDYTEKSRVIPPHPKLADDRRGSDDGGSGGDDVVPAADKKRKAKAVAGSSPKRRAGGVAAGSSPKRRAGGAAAGGSPKRRASGKTPTAGAAEKKRVPKQQLRRHQDSSESDGVEEDGVGLDLTNGLHESDSAGYSDASPGGQKTGRRRRSG